MFRLFTKQRRMARRISQGREVFPDEIFLDSKNLSELDTQQFEGRIEHPIPVGTLIFLASMFVLFGIGYTARAYQLQVSQGAAYLAKSENNRLRKTTVFAERGAITDRDGVALAWNASNPSNTDFALRQYIDSPAFSHVLGYVKYPSKDASGYYYSKRYDAKDGVEAHYDDLLSGENGVKLSETDALGKVQSENTIQLPRAGLPLALSIDAGIQQHMYEAVRSVVETADYKGGAAGLLDVKTGEIVAMTSYPSYGSNVLTEGKDVKQINALFADTDNPFLDRFTDGLYAPGSTVKPFLAIAALQEKIIDPSTQILSTGSISLQNIYDSSQQTVFKDWRANGWTDMRMAIALSSDIYFYEVGGGYKEQKGLGITKIEKYLRLFGFGDTTGDGLLLGKKGVVPNPEWKRENFNEEEWTIGNTYHTSIGQYGTLVTPLQMLVGVATIANDGVVPNVTLLKDGTAGNNTFKHLDVPKDVFRIVKEGMRMTVTVGTATSLNFPDVQVAGKTGSAEIGTQKKFTNSWFTGFFPYKEPRYAVVFVMERGPRTNTVGATSAAYHFLQWLGATRPEMTSLTSE
ncbi:MAG: penicillin-binding transpeptidase domain-containing protein [Patescibacteria group bacterium]